MRGWKSILSKYLIEFTVIVLGITTSYFVENYREEQWESKKEIRLLSELRKEFVDQISHFEKRRELFSKDYRIISFITNNSSDFDSLISDVKRSTQIRTALFDMRYFSPLNRHIQFNCK